MKVKYKDLLDGYVLQDQDQLLIHGMKFIVLKPSSSERGWFLAGCGFRASDIFRLLHIENKFDFAKSVATWVDHTFCIFPEMETAEDLTKLVIALYKRSPYKVGDKVKLVNDLRDKAWVVDEMLEYAGRIVTIDTIEDIDYETCADLNGDLHKYKFEETLFTWPSTTFTPVSTDDSSDASTDQDVKTDKPEERTITKKDLENGYILQIGDILYFKDLRYTVSGGNIYYLRNHLGPNSEVFTKYLPDIDRERLPKSFGAYWTSATGECFPEFSNPKSLSDFVLYIMRLLDKDLDYHSLNTNADPSDVPVVHSGDEIKINPYYTNNIKTTIKL